VANVGRGLAQKALNKPCLIRRQFRPHLFIVLFGRLHEQPFYEFDFSLRGFPFRIRVVLGRGG
jgi:hypothetical protein